MCSPLISYPVFTRLPVLLRITYSALGKCCERRPDTIDDQLSVNQQSKQIKIVMLSLSLQRLWPARSAFDNDAIAGVAP